MLHFVALTAFLVIPVENETSLELSFLFHKFLQKLHCEVGTFARNEIENKSIVTFAVDRRRVPRPARAIAPYLICAPASRNLAIAVPKLFRNYWLPVTKSFYE